MLFNMTCSSTILASYKNGHGGGGGIGGSICPVQERSLLISANLSTTGKEGYVSNEEDTCHSNLASLLLR